METIPRLAAGIARLRKMTADAGRDPAAMQIGYRVQMYGENVPAKGGDGERRLFSGTAADMIGDIRALRDLFDRPCPLVSYIGHSELVFRGIN